MVKHLLSIIITIFSFSFQLNLKKIAIITDIHLNLKYNPNLPNHVHCQDPSGPIINLNDPTDFGKIGCDTNTNLLDLTLDNLKDLVDPDIILIGGDFVSHKSSINQTYFMRVHEYIFKKFQEKFSNSTIIPTIGNNDFIELYNTPIGNTKLQYYSQFRDIFFGQTFSLKNQLNEDFNQTFLKGCYFSVKLNNITLISFDSNYFSIHNNVTDPDFDPTEILTFIENSLSKLDLNEKAIIMFHIPTYSEFVKNKTSFNWKPDYVAQYDEILNNYKTRIISVFSFHTHWSGLGVKEIPVSSFVSSQFSVPAFVFPSVSPVFRNYPGFGILTLDGEKIENIENYFLNVNVDTDFSILPTSKWDSYYNFKEHFLFSSFDGDDIYDFLSVRFPNNQTLRNQYLSMYGGFNYKNYEKNIQFEISDGDIDVNDNYIQFLCDFMSSDRQELDICLKLN